MNKDNNLNKSSETITVIELEKAIEVAKNLLYDLEYGYSMDDLQVELRSFMNSESFEVCV